MGGLEKGVVSLDALLQEVASCSYALRQGVDFPTLKKLWDALGRFVWMMLRAHKGVLLPRLGAFQVGPAMIDSQRIGDCIVPAFQLLEGRFPGVSHEVIRMRPTGKGSMVPPNYHAIAGEIGKHRSACQRLLKDLTQRLAVHIVAGHAVNIPFPTVGSLATNKSGRVLFKFDEDLLELLKSQPQPIRPATSASSCAPSTITSTQCEKPSGKQGEVQGSVPSHVDMEACHLGMACIQPGCASILDGQAEVWNKALETMRRLCLAKDMASSGCVCRIQMEQWLRREGRCLASVLDAASVFDLLDVNQYRDTGKFIVYGTFLEGLSDLIEEHKEQEQLRMGSKGQVNVLQIRTPAPCSPVAASPEENASQGSGASEQQVLFERKDVQAPRSEHELYFLQNSNNQLTRGDCDKFNRHHFRRILTSRGGTHELPPKVGEEPLTVEEVKLLQNGSPQQLQPQTAQDVLPDKCRSARERRQRGVGIGPGRDIVPELLGEHQADSIKKDRDLLFEKRKGTRQFLRESWEHQAKEKAKVKQLFESAEGKWPYIPTHNPYDRFPITSPRYVAPHFVRPLNAPDQSYSLANGCSMWSGL